MSFKNTLKTKRAQGMMEYLGVAMAIAAALLATSLLPTVTDSFRNTVDYVIENDFNGGGEPGDINPGDPGDTGLPPGTFSGEFVKEQDGSFTLTTMSDAAGNPIDLSGITDEYKKLINDKVKEQLENNPQLAESEQELLAGNHSYEFIVKPDGLAEVTKIFDSAGNLIFLPTGNYSGTFTKAADGSVECTSISDAQGTSLGYTDSVKEDVSNKIVEQYPDLVAGDYNFECRVDEELSIEITAVNPIPSAP